MGFRAHRTATAPHPRSHPSPQGLRVVRVLRLVKLLRLLRGQRLLKRWETKVSIDYGKVELGKAMLLTLLFAHWSACVWMLQTTFAETLEKTWVHANSYCVTLADLPEDELASYPEAPPTGSAQVHGGHTFTHGGWQFYIWPDTCQVYGCESPVAIYSASLYWAVISITSIGFGDIHATAHAPGEQVVATVLILLGAVVWGQVIGNHICNHCNHIRNHICNHWGHVTTGGKSSVAITARRATAPRHPP